MDCPTPKTIGQATVTVTPSGYPFWTRIDTDKASILLGHEEARDMLYAMQRIVAYLDFKNV